MCDLCEIRQILAEMAREGSPDPEREEMHNEQAMEYAHRHGLNMIEAAYALTDMPREQR
jgi:hypothetical protein